MPDEAPGIELPTDFGTWSPARAGAGPRAPNQTQRAVDLLRQLAAAERLYTLDELEQAFLEADAIGSLGACRAEKFIVCERRRTRQDPSLYRVRAP